MVISKAPFFVVNGFGFSRASLCFVNLEGSLGGAPFGYFVPRDYGVSFVMLKYLKGGYLINEKNIV